MVTLYIIIGIVAVVAGVVISRQLTLRSVAKLGKTMGGVEAKRAALEKERLIRAKAEQRRGPLPLRHLGSAWARVWNLRDNRKRKGRQVS